MKTLYLDCGMGAAGDMLTAALLELLPDKEEFLRELNGLEIPGVTVSGEKIAKCGIQGMQVTVKVNGTEESEDMHDHVHEHAHDHNCEHTHDHDHGHIHDTSHEQAHVHHHVHSHHHHSGMHEIGHIVQDLPLSEKVKADILAVFSLIAEAESHVHGVPVKEIHFHEVGTMDAIADITAVCLLMDKLAPEKVIVSPVHVGSGHVRCAHGILPVPAPATAYILRNVPIYGGSIRGELCTPTGAALLKHFATGFGEMPVMKTAAIGYGMGKKDFDTVNCVRALLGETEETGDTIVELQCNLDDITSEAIGFAQEQFFEAGALEVYTIPVQMKKSRPGVLLTVMCREEDKDIMLKLFFRNTTTLGVRENVSRRYKLSRTIRKVDTEFGEVRKKVASGYGVTREKYEYEDIARIAKEQEMNLEEVARRIDMQAGRKAED
ncbi:nickel pincer cofactor biosynthesis protein LarC [Fusicatenibacter saccharivorans]|uniref:nickel pincer cofactor biosynthesis protein LarC n=1 Tax=Fusicatenibacter saccharivorans TaxID=1150298 RepID=UPI003CFC49B3